MIAERYGIRLETLKASHLEKSLQWRNAEHVRWNMSYTEIISTEQHRQWFESISNNNNLYFVFSHQGKETGIVNLKAIDWENKTAEAGVFTGDENYLGSMIPYLAVLAMMDLAFYFFRLETLRAKIETQNAAAVSFNESLGYLPAENNRSDLSYRYYEVNESRYALSTQALRKTAAKLYGGQTVITAEEKEDFFLSFAEKSDPRLNLKTR